MLEASVVGAIALKTTCLLVAAGLAAWMLAKSTSAFRHALWTGTLLLSALMPIAVLTLPSLEVIPASWLSPETVEGTSGGTAHAITSTLDVWSVASELWLAGALILTIRLIFSQVGLIRWRLKSLAAAAGSMG